jgi:hypothetical protein
VLWPLPTSVKADVENQKSSGTSHHNRSIDCRMYSNIKPFHAVSIPDHPQKTIELNTFQAKIKIVGDSI